jgi:hypothetical protein
MRKCALNTGIKYLRGAAGNGLGTMIKYLRQMASSTVGNGLGTTIKYLQNATSGAADTAWSPRSITCDAKRVPPRATA